MTQISYKNIKTGENYTTTEAGWKAIENNPDLKSKFKRLSPAKLPTEVKAAVEKKTETKAEEKK